MKLGTLDYKNNGNRRDLLATLKMALTSRRPAHDPCETCGRPAGSRACYTCLFHEDGCGSPNWTPKY